MSGTQIRAFRPLANNATINIAVTATSQPLTLPGNPLGTRAIRLCNVGTQTIFVELSTGTIAAAITTSVPILANTAEVFTASTDINTVSVVASAVGSTLYVTYGEGL